MASLLGYPALNAKMKGMYAKTLTEEDLEELMKQSNLKEAIAFLKAKFSSLESVDETSTRRVLEQELNNVFITDILKLYKYLDKKESKLFTQFILKYELNCVKNVFRNLTTNKDVKMNLKNIDNWTKQIFTHIEKINQVDNEQAFLEIIQNEKYYEIFAAYEEKIEDAPIEEIEVALDKFYFEKIYAEVQSVNAELEHMIGTEIDLLNITAIYRAKKYFEYTPEEIKSIQIPIYYKFRKNLADRLVEANTFEELKNILQETVYKHVFEEENNIEKDATQYLYQIYKNYFQTKQFNICTVFCYMNLMDIEIKNIINIVEGIRYKMEKTEIQKKIII